MGWFVLVGAGYAMLLAGIVAVVSFHRDSREMKDHKDWPRGYDQF